MNVYEKLYKHLDLNFHRVVSHILGRDYYNMGMDVYSCTTFSCNDLIKEYDRLKKSRNKWMQWSLFLAALNLICDLCLIFA